MNKPKTIEERLQAGINFFRNVHPDKMGEIKIDVFRAFVELVDLHLKGETIAPNDLRTEPRQQTLTADEKFDILRK